MKLILVVALSLILAGCQISETDIVSGCISSSEQNELSVCRGYEADSIACAYDGTVLAMSEPMCSHLEGTVIDCSEYLVKWVPE